MNILLHDNDTMTLEEFEHRLNDLLSLEERTLATLLEDIADRLYEQAMESASPLLPSLTRLRNATRIYRQDVENK